MANVGDGPAGTGASSSEILQVDSAADHLAPPSCSAGPRIPRSSSVNVFARERGQPRWLRRSLPPAKRERRRENAESSRKDAAPKEELIVEPPRPRSKSMNFKRSAVPMTSNRAPRSLSFASGSRVRNVRRAQEDTDDDLGFLSFRQLYRRASIRSILPVVQQIKETKSRKWTVAIFSLVAAILASLRGITLAFSSNTTLDLTGAAEQLPSSYLFSTTLISIFAALSQVGALCGGPVGGLAADRFGRKFSMLFSGLPYLVGYMMISFAHHSVSATAFKVLLLTGRFITGVGMGWASAVVAVYIAEISPMKLRGVFGSLNEIMLTLGTILNYGVGSIDGFSYFYASLVAVGIVALFEVTMIWLPDTPRSLLSRGHTKSAERALRILRGNKFNIEGELTEIKESILTRTKKEKKNSIWGEFKKRQVLVPFFYVLMIQFFSQAGGVSAVASYAASIFSDAGVEDPRVTTIYAIGVASLLGNIASFFSVDLLGRKVLLITSGAGVVIGSIMLGTHFFITRPSACSFSNSTISVIEEPCNSHLAPLAILSLVLFRFFFSLGWGPLPWLLLSELLPLSVRGVASGMTTFITSGTAALVSGVYLQYSQLVQPWFAMWTFSIINLAAAIFVLIFIPETKGRSLEEVEKWFEKNTISILAKCRSKNDEDKNDVV